MKSTKRRASRRTPHQPRSRAKPPVTVADVMAKDVVTVSADLSLRETVDLLADLHIGGAPVTSAGKIVGVITANDLLGFEASTPGVPTERPDQMEQNEWGAPEEWIEGTEAPGAFFTEMWADVGADVEERFEQTRGPEWDVLSEHSVAEAMTRRLLTVRSGAALAEAAAHMLRAGVHRLIVQDDGKLAGIVTTTDIVRAVAGGASAPGGTGIAIPKQR
ncbi:MAG: CBS domain-containing protein [Gemmatimonadetes bacterium]|nr:CBS domain-containing protein [Gemmatimonadota bacterium]